MVARQVREGGTCVCNGCTKKKRARPSETLLETSPVGQPTSESVCVSRQKNKKKQGSPSGTPRRNQRGRPGRRRAAQEEPRQWAAPPTKLKVAENKERFKVVFMITFKITRINIYHTVAEALPSAAAGTRLSMRTKGSGTKANKKSRGSLKVTKRGRKRSNQEAQREPERTPGNHGAARRGPRTARGGESQGRPRAPGHPKTKSTEALRTRRHASTW